MGRGTADGEARAAGCRGRTGVPVRWSSRGLCSWFYRGSAWLCHWVQQLLQLLLPVWQLQTFVTVVLQEGGERGGGTDCLGSHEGILRTPCPHEPWQRMVNAMLLLTGSITFLYFTLYGLAERRTSELREVRPEGDPRSLYYSIIFPE